MTVWSWLNESELLIKIILDPSKDITFGCVYVIAFKMILYIF